MVVASAARAIGRVRDPGTAASIVAVVGLSIVYRWFGEALARVSGSERLLAAPILIAILAAATALAVADRHYRYADIWRPLRVLVRGAGAVLFVQFAFDALYPSAAVSNIFIGFFADARLLAGFGVVVGIAAMLRPAFLLPMLLAYVIFRFRVPQIFGLTTTQLDYATLCDVGLFPIGVLLAWRRLGLVSRPEGEIGRLLADPLALHRMQKLVWGLCIGVHLGNYFHSAIAKIVVGGEDAAFWIVNNPTGQAIIYGLHRMNSPIAGWPWLVQGYHDFLTQFAIPLNIAVLALQIAAPLSVLHRRSLIAFTLAFDLLHIGIYASLGAFFFFWIALNVIILMSLSVASDRDFSAPVKLVALVAALFGYLSFSTASLGWLDGRKVVREIFVAHTADGSQIRVPPAVFGLFSYQISHGDLYVPAGHFQARFGGSVFDRKDWADVHGCGPITVGEQPYVPQGGIVRMIRATDRFYREHEWIKRRGLEYWYLLHAPSNPALFPGFDALPMRDIVAWSYIVESSCPGIADGRLKDDIRVRNSYRIAVDQR